MQPAMASSTRPMCKTTPVGCSGYRHRTILAPQTVVPGLAQHGHRKSRRTSLHAPTLEPARQPPTNARPPQQQRLQPAPPPLQADRPG
jgi:hypothetical protein